MKKLSFFVLGIAAACLYGCSDDDNTPSSLNCVNGQIPSSDGKTCIDNPSSCSTASDCGVGFCDQYAADGSKQCSCGDNAGMNPSSKKCECLTGYKQNGLTCIKDASQDVKDCKHGTYTNGVCACENNWTLDANGTCTIQVDTENDCPTTFVYQNNEAKGKDVYLIGDFNEWRKNDTAYKFTENNGVFTLTIMGKDNAKFAKGSSTSFKIYIGGLPDDQAYRSDASCTSGDDHNCALNVTCGQTITINDNKENSTPNPDECITTFTYYNQYANAENNVSGVYLVGSFNDWTEQDPNYLMTTDGNGKWTIDVKWPVGTNVEYKYIVFDWADDKWKTDAADGTSNGVANITQCGMKFPGGGGGGSVVSGGDFCGQIDDNMTSGGNYTINGSDPNAQIKSIKVEGLNITVEFKDTPSSVRGEHNPSLNGNKMTVTVPSNGKYTYFVNVNGSEVYVPVWVEKEQFDWHNALLYFAFTDRFVNGDQSNDKKSGTWENSSATDWYGGDFKGMQQKVESGYFDALGVNTIWISSVSMNTQQTSADSKENADGQKHNYSAYHSYWPISSFMTAENKSEFGDVSAIEPHFGTAEDLKNLVDACHKRGIRVLVDFAANHVHKDSPMFQKHGDWFNGNLNDYKLCDDGFWDDAYWTERCWFSQDLPDINYDNDYARNQMVQHAIWLIKETNIDGFRVDAVKHMNIKFIQELRSAVDQLFKNTGIMFYMVGETFVYEHDLLNKYIGDDLLHAQFDFPLYGKIGSVLRGNGLYDAIHNGKSGYDGGFKSDLMGTFMGNHDVARAISVAAGQNESKWGFNATPTEWYAYDRVMAAWTILLTQPGVPLIYYGDEYGMPGSNDPDNRRMMQFDGLNEQQQTLLGFVQSLGKIRKTHKALSRGTREILGLQNGSSDNSTVCYKMSYDGESIIVGIGLPDNSGHGPGVCDLKQDYTLVNLFDPDCSETTTRTLDLSTNKFQVWLVK